MDLVFGRPRYQPGDPLDLVFGDSGGSVELPLTVEGTIYFAPMTFAGTAIYDNRLPSYVSTAASARHQSATPAQAQQVAPWDQPAPASRGAAERWQSADRVDAAPTSPWDKTERADAPTRVGWQAATPVSQRRSAVHQVCTPLDVLRAIGWQLATPATVNLLAPHQVADVLHLLRTVSAETGTPITARAHAPHQVATPAQRAIRARWQVAAQLIPLGLTIYVPGGGNGITPHPVDLDLVFECPPYEAGQALDLVFGHVCLPPVAPGLIVVPSRSVYMIINSASLRRVDNNVLLPALSTSLTLDHESWTWSFAADLPASSAALISRSVANVPVEVELTVNGQPFRALIETVGRNRTADDWRITVRGRGLAAVLDAPYFATRTHGNTTPRTAQQLANDALTINNVPIGWTVDWQLTDWLVPADIWSLQGSPIAAVNAIAAAAGGYVQPHPTLKTLRVLPRFPVAPWNWGTVVPDIELPTGPVNTESVEWLDYAEYNRVFISGTVGGVLGQVTRQGSAGDVLAPMVTDSLITHVDAARQRGIAELAKGGHWANVTLRLPILQETGIILPGKMIRYDDGDVDMLGITRSVSVQDDGNEIWQSIGVSSYVA